MAFHTERQGDTNGKKCKEVQVNDPQDVMKELVLQEFTHEQYEKET